MKAILQKKLERLNAKKTALTTRAMNSTDANEVRSINDQLSGTGKEV